MKKLQTQLQKVSKTLQALAEKTEGILKEIESAKKPARKAKKAIRKRTIKKKQQLKPVKPAEAGTAYEIFLKTIEGRCLLCLSFNKLPE